MKFLSTVLLMGILSTGTSIFGLAPQSEWGLDPNLPTLKGKQYIIKGELGHGAQAKIWEAYDTIGKRWVAIKCFTITDFKEAKEVELAEREIATLQRIHHDRVPGYIDDFSDDQHLYLVMEKIDGEPVSELLGKKLFIADTIQFLRDAATLLGYLKSCSPPIVNRDIKPSNIMRKNDGTFAFLDFGSAGASVLKEDGGSTVTGTFGYMAPEQIYHTPSPLMDVFSIGMTALSMLTGQDAGNFERDKTLNVNVSSILKTIDLSPELKNLLQRMVKAIADERPADLQAELAGIPEFNTSPAPASNDQGEPAVTHIPSTTALAIEENLSDAIVSADPETEHPEVRRPTLPARFYRWELLSWFKKNPLVHAFLTRLYNRLDVLPMRAIRNVLTDEKALPVLEHLVRKAYEVKPQWSALTPTQKFDHGEPIFAAELSPTEDYVVTASGKSIKI